MKKLLTAALVTVHFLFTPACADEATARTQQVSVDHVHELKCGCAIEGIGKCGEFIKIDGKFLKLTFPAELKVADKPFCKKEGLKAKVEGSVLWGGYVARSFEFVNASPK